MNFSSTSGLLPSYLLFAKKGMSSPIAGRLDSNVFSYQAGSESCWDGDGKNDESDTKEKMASAYILLSCRS